MQEESSESDSEEEFVYCSDGSSEGEDFTDEEDEETPDVVDCSPGRYVLFRLTKQKYYVSCCGGWREPGDIKSCSQVWRASGENNLLLAIN